MARGEGACPSGHAGETFSRERPRRWRTSCADVRRMQTGCARRRLSQVFFRRASAGRSSGHCGRVPPRHEPRTTGTRHPGGVSHRGRRRVDHPRKSGRPRAIPGCSPGTPRLHGSRRLSEGPRRTRRVDRGVDRRAVDVPRDLRVLRRRCRSGDGHVAGGLGRSVDRDPRPRHRWSVPRINVPAERGRGHPHRVRGPRRTARERWH